MKYLRCLLLLAVLQPAFSAVAQKYKLFSSDDRVYYKSGIEWKRVYHNSTELNLESVIKTNKNFSVIEDKMNGAVTKCSAEPNGQRLAAIITKGYTTQNVVLRTSTSKGEDLSSNSPEIALPFRDLPVNLHYLLVGVHHFDDAYFAPLPLPNVNVQSLSRAIENNMVPSNNYNIGYHQTICDDNETRLDGINQALTALLDSLKPNNNDMVMLYFSSHGVKDQGNQFHFITSDSRYDSVAHQMRNTMTAAHLNQYVNKMAAKGAKVLVFVDACYSGTIIMDIRQMDGSSVYFMSTENDLIANDDNEKGSPFARALTRSISGEEQVYFRECNRNMVNANNLSDYLYRKVKEEFRDQTPQSNRYNFDEKQKLWKIPSPLSVTIDSLLQEVRIGKTSAMIRLGDIYFEGSQKDNVEKDTAKALNLYRYASEWGDPCGTSRLGLYYFYDSQRTDYRRAFQLFEEAAAADDDLGKYYLSVCYYKGRGTTPDKKKAKKVFKKIKSLWGDVNKALAKEEVFFPIWIGKDLYSNMVVRQGIVYFIVKGTYDPAYDRKHRPEHYFAHIKTLAHGGEANAQAELGHIYIFGDYNQKQNYQEGFKWYSEAAKQGNKYGQLGIGICYERGLGTEKDYKKASEYYIEAASKGLHNANALVGCLYHTGGYGLEKDVRLAFEYFSKSAAKGDAYGMLRLGMCYKEGKAVKVDNNKAFDWFQKSAKQGNEFAQYFTGMAYLKGEGTDKDSQKAYDWLKKAEKANNTFARQALDQYFWADGSLREF